MLRVHAADVRVEIELLIVKSGHKLGYSFSKIRVINCAVCTGETKTDGHKSDTQAIGFIRPILDDRLKEKILKP